MQRGWSTDGRWLVFARFEQLVPRVYLFAGVNWWYLYTSFLLLFFFSSACYFFRSESSSAFYSQYRSCPINLRKRRNCCWKTLVNDEHRRKHVVKRKARILGFGVPIEAVRTVSNAFTLRHCNADVYEDHFAEVVSLMRSIWKKKNRTGS